ncbi:hypothetical protein Dda_6282 [Drechslerella dactyloides]|uniref:F-box domain-containing protein n=1 Tax=Drechslerella dactyloides TaxID=74499 RepID=A0AAD6IZH9_DREDA|nr:hypothetical protein Dda_6282 [Drechslerella dactyloides]
MSVMYPTPLSSAAAEGLSGWELDDSSNAAATAPPTHPRDSLLAFQLGMDVDMAFPLDQSYVETMDLGDSSGYPGLGSSSGENVSAGTADMPIVVDSESEDDVEKAANNAAGPFASPAAVSSNFSPQGSSIFDTPPCSATSTATADSFIPEFVKQIIDLTRDEPSQSATTPASSSKGKAKVTTDLEVIDVDAIFSMNARYFDDDMGLVESPALSVIEAFPPAVNEDDAVAEMWQSIEDMMNTEEAQRRMRYIDMKLVEQTSTITKLPSEILSMIFEQALPWFNNPALQDPMAFQDRLKGATPFMKVCRRWRYTLLPQVLKSITISECTFLTKSAHCAVCISNNSLVSVPVVRSLFDGTSTPESRQVADFIKTVAISPSLCERRQPDGEDSLESGFVFFLPNIESVVLPSHRVKSFLNAASKHGHNLGQKSLPNIRIYNTSHHYMPQPRRRLGFQDPLDITDVADSWVIPEDIKKLEIEGECLRLCTSWPMLLLEDLTINGRNFGDKLFTSPPPSTICQFLSCYTTDFSVLSRITIRWLPKTDQGLPIVGNTPPDICLCSVFASIPSLEHLDASTVCPLLFGKKTGKCISSVVFEYPCATSRHRPPPPTKHHNLRALVGPAAEMRARLIPADIEPSRVPTLISLATIRSRDRPESMELSLNTPPSYTLDFSRNVVRVTEYSAKAATRYKQYINGLVGRSMKSIVAREDKRLLSEYAIAARAKSLTDSWQCVWNCLQSTKKQRSVLIRWDYEVDMEVFFNGAVSGEFMVLGRQKDRLLNTREAEERKARKLEMEKLKSAAAAAPKKRTKKRKADAAVDESIIGASQGAILDGPQKLAPIETTTRRKKRRTASSLPPIAKILGGPTGSYSAPALLAQKPTVPILIVPRRDVQA